MIVRPLNTALVLGLFIALWHVCWSLLVATGLAQSLLNFVFWAHFINPPFHVEPFEIGRALILVGAAFGVGFVMGGMIGMIWNTLQRPAKA